MLLLRARQSHDLAFLGLVLVLALAKSDAKSTGGACQSRWNQQFRTANRREWKLNSSQQHKPSIGIPFHSLSHPKSTLGPPFISPVPLLHLRRQLFVMPRGKRAVDFIDLTADSPEPARKRAALSSQSSAPRPSFGAPSSSQRSQPSSYPTSTQELDYLDLTQDDDALDRELYGTFGSFPRSMTSLILPTLTFIRCQNCRR